MEVVELDNAVAEDVMSIKTRFVRDILAGILERMVKKKLGIDPLVTIHALRVKNSDECARVHLELDCAVSRDDLGKIIRLFGL